MFCFVLRRGYDNTVCLDRASAHLETFWISKADILEMIRRLRRAGVKMGVGTDLVTDWFRYATAL